MRQNEGADEKMALGADSSCFLKERLRRTNFNAVSPQRDRLFLYTQCPPPHHCSCRQATGHHPIWHHSDQQLPKKHRTKGIPHGRASSAVACQAGASSNQKPRSLGNKASPEVKSTHKQEYSREEPSYSWAEVGLLGQGCGWRGLR